MGLFLRKALSVGPVRINLSKSGFGTSVGVKGARLSSGPSGVHVFAGRNGMYYRKSLNSKTSKNRKSQIQQTTTSAKPISTKGLITLLAIICIIIFLYLRSFADLVTQLGFVFLALGVGITYFLILRKQKVAISRYRDNLNVIFSSPNKAPTDKEKSQNRLFKQALPTSKKYEDKINSVKQNTYETVIEKTLAEENLLPGHIAFVDCAEELLGLPSSYYLSVKKDILNATYLEVISDRFVSDEEEEAIKKLIKGLMIPIVEIQKELSVLEDVKKAQSLQVPLQKVSTENLPYPITRNESVYLISSAQIYTRRKIKQSIHGYEYTQKRDGNIAVTSKKITIRDNGNTVIKLSDIENIEVDIDRNFVLVFKHTSGKPTIIGFEFPLYLGRLIDILSSKSES